MLLTLFQLVSLNKYLVALFAVVVLWVGWFVADLSCTVVNELTVTGLDYDYFDCLSELRGINLLMMLWVPGLYSLTG